MMDEKFISVKVRGIILKDGKIFLAKLKRAGFYCLPGGTLEKGETRKEWLEREIIEELWVKPVIGRLLYTQEFMRSDGSTTFDFWYEIKNVEDFDSVDLDSCSHGFENEEVWFYDILSGEASPHRPLHLRALMEKWNKKVEFIEE